MALFEHIRRWHLREQVPIREISRRTGVSRNTIRRYLRSDVIAPKFRGPDRPSKLDPYAVPSSLRAYLLQTHERLSDAHNHAFRVLGGMPRRGIYDNMRTAVDKVGRGKECSVNARLLTMTSRYLFETEFCNPAARWGRAEPWPASRPRADGL